MNKRWSASELNKERS